MDDLAASEATFGIGLADRESRRGSLVFRCIAGALLLLVMAAAVAWWQFGAVAERDLMRGLTLRESREAEFAATLMNRRVREMRATLEAVAEQVDERLLSNPQAAATFLSQRSTLRRLFSNTFVTDRTGRMVALVDGAGERFPTSSIADRDYFKRSVAERIGVISTPVMGKVSREPVLVFVHPIVVRDEVIGVLAGGLRLASQDLLEELGASRAQGSGSFAIVSDAEGRILAHPVRARLLEGLDTEISTAAAYGRWLEGGKAMPAAIHHDPSQAYLVSSAADPVSGWRIWRVTARSEAMAPLQREQRSAEQTVAVAVSILALLLSTLLWLQLRPIRDLRRVASSRVRGDRSQPWPSPRSEVGELAAQMAQAWQAADCSALQLGQVRQQLDSVMSAAPVGIAFTRNGKFELVSADLCKLLGRPESEIVGHGAQLVFASNADYAALGPQVGEAFSKGLVYSGEWRLLHAGGAEFWGQLRAQPVVAGDPSAGTIWSMINVHEQVLARDQLQHAASHDPLTGVANRQGFERELEETFGGQPSSRPAALVMIDLDHFKPINDTAGHAAGDAMLVAVAQTITSRVRGTDVVVRLGGDEFALLLRNCPLERALAVAEKVRSAIEALSLSWSGHTLCVGASLGVVELSETHLNAAQWLADADAACYEAKRAGRGMVRLAPSNLRVVHGKG